MRHLKSILGIILLSFFLLIIGCDNPEESSYCYWGCTDDTACNYNSSALADHELCTYPDDNGVCTDISNYIGLNVSDYKYSSKPTGHSLNNRLDMFYYTDYISMIDIWNNLKCVLLVSYKNMVELIKIADISAPR